MAFSAIDLSACIPCLYGKQSLPLSLPYPHTCARRESQLPSSRALLQQLLNLELDRLKLQHLAGQVSLQVEQKRLFCALHLTQQLKQSLPALNEQSPREVVAEHTKLRDILEELGNVTKRMSQQISPHVPPQNNVMQPPLPQPSGSLLPLGISQSARPCSHCGGVLATITGGATTVGYYCNNPGCCSNVSRSSLAAMSAPRNPIQSDSAKYPCVGRGCESLVYAFNEDATPYSAYACTRFKTDNEIIRYPFCQTCYNGFVADRMEALPQNEGRSRHDLGRIFQWFSQEWTRRDPEYEKKGVPGYKCDSCRAYTAGAQGLRRCRNCRTGKHLSYPTMLAASGKPVSAMKRPTPSTAEPVGSSVSQFQSVCSACKQLNYRIDASGIRRCNICDPAGQGS